MPTVLPPARGFRILQSPGRITRKTLASIDHLLLLTPPRAPAGTLRDIPGVAALEAIGRRLGRHGEARVLRGRVGNTATGLSWARLAVTEGDASSATFHQLKRAGELAQDALGDAPRSLGLVVDGFPPDVSTALVHALVLGIGAQAHHGPLFSDKPPPAPPRTLRLLGQPEKLDLARTLVEVDNLNLVRWLTALPSNHLTVASFCEALATLAGEHGWEYTFYDEEQLGALAAGAFLAVARGSGRRDAGIVRLRHRPAGRNRTDLALVGKGILFDTGGNNLKDAKHMLDMHNDMSGSAVALGVLCALQALDSPLGVDCWLALTENRIGPEAYKPRDVVTACNGTTIEVIHTDAEGRMALADTLALAGRESPDVIIDYATLTGACVYALSERYSGVFTNRDALHAPLIAAGRRCGERVWPFPLDDDFDEDLKSEVADIAQCTMSGAGDHILAARFLRRFVPQDCTWIHVDLSSVTRKNGLAQVPGGPTGFGVRYSLALLLDTPDVLDAGTAAGPAQGSRR